MGANKIFRFDKEQTNITYEIYGQILEALKIVDDEEFGEGSDRQARIEKYCLDNIVLEDSKMDGAVFGKYIEGRYNGEEERKAIAKEQLSAILDSDEYSPATKMYLSQMSQDFIPYDTVLTAGIVVGQNGKSLQMGCGQGKTGVLAFAAYDKLERGEQVFLTTSTPILAKEALDTLEYYNNLGRAQDLVLVRPEGITKAELDDEGNVQTYIDKKGKEKVKRLTISFKNLTPEEKENMLKDVYENSPLVVSDNGTLMQHYMEGILSSPKGQRALLADEADYSLLDSYQPVQKTKAYSKEVVEERINYRTKAYEILETVKASTKDLYNLDEDNQYVDFTQEGKAKVVSLIDQMDGDFDKTELYDMVYDALVVDTVYKENRDYQVLDDRRTIISENRASGAEMDLPQGVQQALEIKLRQEGKYKGKITPEREVLSVTNIQKFFLDAFSKGKTGFISGTLGLDSDEIVAELEENFAITSDGEKGDIYNIPPREESIREDAGKTVFMKKSEKQQAIVENALEQAKAGRPVLIGAVSEKEIHELQALLKGQGTRLIEYTAASENIFQRDTRNFEMTDEAFKAKYGVDRGQYQKYEDYIKVEAGKANTITLGTSIIGRGTTIKTEKSINEAGGIHVIVDGLHETSSRNQEQYLARTARGSNRGSTVEFFALQDIPQTAREEALKGITSIPTAGTKENKELANEIYKRTYKSVDSRTSQIRSNVVNLMEKVENAKTDIEIAPISHVQKKRVIALVSARARQVQNRAVGVSDKVRYHDYEKQIEAYTKLYIAREKSKDKEKFDERDWLEKHGYDDVSPAHLPFSKAREERIINGENPESEIKNKLNIIEIKEKVGTIDKQHIASAIKDVRLSQVQEQISQVKELATPEHERGESEQTVSAERG